MEPSDDPVELPAAKRVRRGVSDANKELYSCFSELDEPYISENGKRHGSLCICLYCDADYQSKVTAGRFPPPLEVAKIRKTKRDCENHLKKCSAYRMFKRSTTNGPSAEEADPQQGAAAATQPGGGVQLVSPSPGPGPARGPTKTLHSYYPLARLSKSELENSLDMLVEFIVDSRQPYAVVQRPSFLRLVDSLRPGASKHMPSRQTVSHALIPRKAEVASTNIKQRIAAALRQDFRIGLIVDGWVDVNRCHIDGYILKVGGEDSPLCAIEASAEGHAIAVAKDWESLIVDGHADIPGAICYLVSDDAGACSRARRILKLRHPHVVFVMCWAHQINLMVKHLLQGSEFSEWAKKAIEATNAINKSSSKHLPDLRSSLEHIYGKKVALTLHSVGETRWNTMQATLAAQLRVRTGLKLWASSDDRSPPSKCEVWTDSTFWMKCEEAELLIRPFCDASFLMQRKKNTMAHVVFILIHLCDHIVTYCGESDLSTAMLADIEKRWATEENALFFLAFSLHPSFHQVAVELLSRSEKQNGNWRKFRNKLSVARLSHAAGFYYEKFELFVSEDEIGKASELAELAKQVRLWLRGNKLDTSLFKGESQESVVQWWKMHEVETPQIVRLAMFILDCPVQSADCERLFKDWAVRKTKQRNRLKTEKMFLESKIMHDMTCRYKQAQATTTSKNRFVKPDQYPVRFGAYTGVAASNDQGEEDSGRAKQADNEVHHGGRDRDEDHEGSDDEDNNDDNSNAEVAVFDDGDDIMETWLECLRECVEDDDDVYEHEDCGEDGTPTNGDHSDDEEDDMIETPCETRPVVLKPLPEDNDPNWPQENAAYFAGKKYTRTDKYLLSEMVALGCPLPTIASIYSNN